jgi:hypothetical protein
LNEQGNTFDGQTLIKKDTYQMQEMRQSFLSYQKENLCVLRIRSFGKIEKFHMG